MSLKPLNFFFILAAISVAPLVPSPVRACPPGFYTIGGGSAGWIGCAPMDGGVSTPAPRPAPPPMVNSGVTLPGGSTYDAPKWTDLFAETRSLSLKTFRERFVKKHGEAAAKTFDDLAAGVWTIGRSPAGESAPACAATFWTLNGGVILMDWKGAQPGTALMFFGKGIPNETEVKRMRVSLVQSGKTQTVEVLASRFPFVADMGMIFFKVPSSEALLSSIKDTQDFVIHRDGHEFLSGKWHSAESMRTDLTECIDQITRETSQPRSKGDR